MTSKQDLSITNLNYIEAITSTKRFCYFTNFFREPIIQFIPHTHYFFQLLWDYISRHKSQNADMVEYKIFAINVTLCSFLQ